MIFHDLPIFRPLLYFSFTSLPPSSSGAPLKRAKLGAMRSCFPWRQKMALKAKSFGQIFGRSLEKSPSTMENHHVLIGKPIGSMYDILTFTINIPPMLAYIPYMDPMGNQLTKFWIPSGKPTKSHRKISSFSYVNQLSMGNFL